MYDCGLYKSERVSEAVKKQKTGKGNLKVLTVAEVKLTGVV